MFLSDLSIKRPILVSMGLIFFLLFGALSYFNMSLDLFPNVEIPYITIQTVYIGSGPKEIETQVTKKIEDAISSVSKIERVTSYSMDGVSFLVVQFALDKDVDIANQEIKDKVDGIVNELPLGAELPVVAKLNVQEFPIIDLILTGDISNVELYDLADKRIKDQLAQLDGVARVEVIGGQEREIQVALDSRTVHKNNISLAQLSQILAAQNMDMPGGHFEKRAREFTVRMSGKFTDVADVEALEIPTAFGNKRLSDVAEIIDGGAEVRERTSYYNNFEKYGDPDVVLLSLTKSASGNAVRISEGVREIIPGINNELPSGSRLEVVNDQSVFVRSSVSDTLQNILLGILLTGVVLLFFLHDVRSTLIVAVAMPISMISAFWFMDRWGFSLNVMSLMGLSTSVGILVANSVVVLENIFRHKEMGHDRRTASSVGTSEVVVAVIASTMTNIAVFLPLATMKSLAGRMLVEFALTVTIATIFSLLVSFTVTPMMASLLLRDHDKKKHRIGDKLEAWFRRMEVSYGKILEAVLANKRRGLVVIGISVVLFVLSLPLAGKIGFAFMPSMDQGDIRIEVELPLGYSLNETAATLQTIEERIKKYDVVHHFVTTMGRHNEINVGTNLAVMKVKLVDAGEREQAFDKVAGEFIEDLSDIPNVRIRAAAVQSGKMGERPPVTFYVMGQDMDRVEQYKDEIIKKIKDIPGLVNLNTSSRRGKPEISITPNRSKMADAGVTVYDLALSVRGALAGLVSTELSDAGEDYDIRVMLSDQSADTPEEVGNIMVAGSRGKFTLSQLADIKFAEGYNKIDHTNKYKSIEINGAPAPGVALGDVVKEIQRRTAEIDLPPGYRIDWGGLSELMQDAVVDMLRAFLIAIFLTYMLLAAILEDLKQPLLVLGTVPLALIGVFGGMYLTGATMNIISMMAIVMLLGIVVNNAILILDYANILVRQRGYDVRAALLEAAPAKLRPIIMSTIAIILGMLPMAAGLGDAGKEMRQPMGIVAIGGLLVSTVLTLVVIPALWNMVSKKKAAVEVTSNEQGQ